MGIGALFLLLLIQKFAILPRLDATLAQTVAGQPTTEDSLHFVYAAMDTVKIVVLFVLSLLLRVERG